MIRSVERAARTLAWAAFAVVSLGVAALGCSSSSSSSGSPTTDPFSTDGRNGQQETREQACAQYLAALVAAETRTHCAVDPAPSCPALLDTFEQQKLPGICVAAYDVGSLDNCAARLATFTSCSDFGTKSCVLVAEPAEDAGCNAGDAGLDASPDTANADAADAPLDDAGTDDAPLDDAGGD